MTSEKKTPEAKKPTKDVSSMLGSARRAQDVPRPQATPPAQPEVQPQAEEKAVARRINITLDAGIHRRMKIMAAERAVKLQPLVDEILEAYLKTQNR